jgi:molecular chaperone GrpE
MTPKTKVKGNNNNEVNFEKAVGNEAENNQQIDESTNFEQELAQKDQEITTWKNSAMRQAADNENLRKQNELDIAQGAKKTKKLVMSILMPFINSVNLSFSFVPKTDDAAVTKFVDSLKTQMDKLVKDLVNVGVEIIIPNRDDKFDPVIMTALNTPEGEELIVKQVVGLGLKIDNQVVQAATVLL